MQILVDADACPVVSIVERVAKEHNLPVTLLCDTNHVLSSDYSAVLGVEIGNFQHAAIGGSDSIAGAFPNDGLCGFFHSVFPPLPVRRFWCLTGYVFIVHIIAHSHKAVLPKSCKVFW